MAKISLQKKERILLGVALALAALVLSQWLLSSSGPLKAYRKSGQDLANAGQALEYARGISLEMKARRQHAKAVDNLLARRGGFSLFSFIEDTVRSRELINRTDYESVSSGRGKSNFENVRLELDGVSMDELLTLLVDICASENLIVLREVRELKPKEDGKGLFCSMRFISPRG